MIESASAKNPIKLVLLQNAAVLIAYWGISHLNWIVFKNVGVLPMPIWPAAAVALVSAIVLGWHIAPGIALGTILANHFSLGGSWTLACCISIMNTIGPVFGAILIRRRIAGKPWSAWNRRDITLLFFSGAVLVPMLTATGGIGGKLILGLMTISEVPLAFMRWEIAHTLGTILFAPPLLLWLYKENSDEAKPHQSS